MIKVNNNLILLGMPGSGKGTISSTLEKQAIIVQVSTGDIFREEIKNKTELGLKVKKIVESGSYVPDDITNEIVKNKIQSLQQENKHFILDGFPRTVQQAEFLDRLGFQNFVVIYLEIETEKVIERLSQRFFCSKCKKTFNMSNLKSSKHPYCENDENELIQRPDDQPESVKKRLEVYNNQTKPLINFYRSKNKLFTINSDGEIDQITNKILDIIK